MRVEFDNSELSFNGKPIQPAFLARAVMLALGIGVSLCGILAILVGFAVLPLTLVYCGGREVWRLRRPAEAMGPRVSE